MLEGHTCGVGTGLTLYQWLVNGTWITSEPKRKVSLPSHILEGRQARGSPGLSGSSQGLARGNHAAKLGCAAGGEWDFLCRH